MNKPLEYTAKLNGAKDDMVRWLVTINGQTFDYGEGIGHFVTGGKNWKNPQEVSQAIAEKIATGANTRDINNTLAFHYKPTKRLPKARWDNRSGLFLGIGEVLPPELDAVLYCLVSDAEAEGMGFGDWCANFGFDEDSRKALATYLECQETAQKLRKAGVDIAAERERLADF